MASLNSKIEWTDRTWNCVKGCSLVSQGCKNCYAMRQAHRFHGPGQPYEGLTQIANGHPVWTGKVVCDESKLDEPLHWRKPCRVFVNSMSDLFQEDVPFEFIGEVLTIIGVAKQHTFQVLTKRPARMREFMASHDCIGTYPPPNLWLGVSVEDQETADERIPLLLQTPAAVRWVSYEPALGPVNLAIPKGFVTTAEKGRIPDRYSALMEHTRLYDEGDLHWPKIDWVVVGGESGPGARPMHPDWARSVRDQCVAAGVPFFMKQMGGVRDKRGALESLPTDLQIREYPNASR